MAAAKAKATTNDHVTKEISVMRQLGFNVCMTALLGSILGCGSGPDDTAAGGSPLTIAWITKGKSVTTVYDPGRKGAALAGQDLTSASGRKVTVAIMEAEDNTPVKQVPIIQEAIDKKVDAIGIAVTNADTIAPLIDQAVDAGIKVLTWDTDAPSSKRLSYYNMKQYDSGKVTAQLFNSLLAGTGKIVTVSPVFQPPSQNHMERMQGMADEIAARFPSLELVADQIECGLAQEKPTENCTKLLDAALVANPDAKGYYFSRGLPLRSASLEANAPNFCAAVKNGTIKVVGLDSTPDALANMQAGFIHALIGQKYFGWGYDVVSLSFDVLTIDRKLDVFTDSKFDVVCQNNLEATLAMWNAQDFRSKLTPCSLLP
jgi:ribose transport system substrate-binding protein